jgi:hypothetical protein
MLDDMVLAKIYLAGVLPALEPLTAGNAEASLIAGQWSGTIRFAAGLGGPRSDVIFREGRIKVVPEGKGRCDIFLFFPTLAMANALFAGKGFSLPLPLKGLTRIKGLMVFSRLAKHMEQVLDGRAGPENLRSRMTLGIMGRSMAVIAANDPEMAPLAKKLHGIAEFRIREGQAVHVDFSGSTRFVAGPSGAPDFLLEFASDGLFLKVAEDKVDVLAEACLLNIALKGDLHMGQIVNTLLDRIALYLPPKEVAA